MGGGPKCGRCVNHCVREDWFQTETGQGQSSDSPSNKVLTSLHFLGKGTLAVREARKGRAQMWILVSLTRTPCVALTSQEAASFLAEGTA